MSSVHQRDKPFNCDGTTIIEERWEIHIIIWRGNIAIINASGKVNISRIGVRGQLVGVGWVSHVSLGDVPHNNHITHQTIPP